MEHSLRRFAGLLAVDPSGAVAEAVRWIPRYRPAVEQRHAAIMSHWMAGEHDAALVELHFCMTAASRIVAFINVTAKHIEGEVKTHVSSRDFCLLVDARNHFEHAEDRLYGSGRNRPQPITEGGVARTVHFSISHSETRRSMCRPTSSPGSYPLWIGSSNW
ncbi:MULTISPECIES: hypothetical protein [unclassified Ensifer]|uniref:hypothetical protein n=1 Tax=unclassified Ensifer TaxID=2633371 RepID=UPI0008130356|nr:MULTISPECIES: hypothetical protein [unclassified Ensifer]OCP03940.1 hypothetical protein BBX50_26450 [Ensifer sp. LC11]OCP04381.1 hypothetical protein BC374_26460 [Ensifer sp. LC13]OCP08537.1 hypothetical protein BC362_01950 [Ensifer sp. LC14]OCP30379.1 hypothetical protein BC364_26200 [Ensifer sp. LC499]